MLIIIMIKNVNVNDDDVKYILTAMMMTVRTTIMMLFL